MRFSLLAATALGTTLASIVPGVAQDATYDWSGFYIGASLGIAGSDSASIDYPDNITDNGYSFYDNDLYLDGGLQVSGLPTLFELNPGAGLGVQAGYNFVSGNLVYGVQADIHLLSQVNELAYSEGNGATVSVQSGLDSLATLRGRVGVSADKMLLFATAGLAAGQSTLATDFQYSDLGKSSASLSGSTTSTLFGFAAGAGGEFALSEQVSLKGEALYYDLGSSSATATGSGESSGGDETAEPYTVSVDNRGVIVSTGLNFRF